MRHTPTLPTPNSFQFHIGSIKRRPDPKYFLSEKASFNSTLVRLKGLLRMSCTSTRNSFNSTLVRLKGYCLPLKRLSAYSFNSTLVRLKVPPGRRLPACISRFNSTLVRLKAIIEDSFRHSGESFQFHIGSIKRSRCFHSSYKK